MMKSYLLLICFVLQLFSYTLSAQSKRTVELLFAPDIAWRNKITPEYGGLPGSVSKAATMFNCGIAMTSRIGHGFSTKIGLQFGHMGYRDSIPSRGRPANGISVYHERKISHRFWSVPLLLRYEKDLGKRLNWYTEGGLALQLYQNTRTKVHYEAEYQPEQVVSNPNISKFSYAFILGSGISYRLSGRWAVFAQPTLRYLVKPLSNGSLFQERLYAVGLETGIKRSW